MVSNNILFSIVDWFRFAQHRCTKLKEEVADLDGNQLLNTSVDDLCEYFVKKYRIDVPVLNRSGILVDQCETQIDVSKDPLRAISDRSQPFCIPGTEIEIIIPFTGDSQTFTITPITYSLNRPSGKVGDGTLTFFITGENLEADKVRLEIDQKVDHIDSYLTNLREDADTLNRQLDSIVRQCIEQRREKLLAAQNLVASLGFKLKQRTDSPKTYTAPEVRRKTMLTPPQASSTSYAPEPALDEADYEHILEVIENMAQVMERSRSAFSEMDEESLRWHFLVQLNGHYEGHATGETFNYEGKTDILIRSEGKNIFIAECKYWAGPQKLTEAIDQLLSYSSWRDTKVAVIVFNRNKGFTRVLDTIKLITKAHPNFKRELGDRSETSFRFIFSHRDDTNRELTLTIMAFDIPQ